jgi:hypothetical protein
MAIVSYRRQLIGDRGADVLPRLQITFARIDSLGMGFCPILDDFVKNYCEARRHNNSTPRAVFVIHSLPLKQSLFGLLN